MAYAGTFGLATEKFLKFVQVICGTHVPSTQNPSRSKTIDASTLDIFVFIRPPETELNGRSFFGANPGTALVRYKAIRATREFRPEGRRIVPHIVLTLRAQSESCANGVLDLRERLLFDSDASEFICACFTPAAELVEYLPVEVQIAGYYPEMFDR